MESGSQSRGQLPFDPDGTLPPGEHKLGWFEFVAQFGMTAHRRNLIRGLWEAAMALKQAGCTRIWVGGSFVTSKQTPGDFDACWDVDGVDLRRLQRLAPVLLMFENERAAQKAKYRGELFPAQQEESNFGVTFLEFFQLNKESGERKGIVAIDLESLDS